MKVSGINTVMRDLTLQFDKSSEAERNKVMKRLVNNLKERTPIDTGAARDGWKINKGKIENEVDYISFLNEGYSKQAPARFIEATLLSDPQVKPAGIIVKYKVKDIGA